MAGRKVLIVGAGISALIAAEALLQRGDTVTIYERRTRKDYGGQCNWAFGGFFFADSPEQRLFRIHDSHELAWEDWQGYAEFDEASPYVEHQKYWAKRYIERAVPDVHDWMTGRGMRFFPTANWAERAGEGKGNRVPRFHLLWGCGPELSKNMRAGLDEYEGRALTLHFEHTVTGLVETNGAITGLRGTTGEGSALREWEDTGDAVVLASGGFTGNLDRVRAWWPEVWNTAPDDEHLQTGVWPEMDGAVHDQAERAGAQLVNMSNMWVYAAGVYNWRGDVPNQGAAIIPMKSALWMQSDGARFDPPLLAGYDTRDAVTRICAQDNPWTWAVLNRDILNRELTIQGSDYNRSFREKSWTGVGKDLLCGAGEFAQEFLDRCPDVVTAPTLEELVQRMNQIDPGVEAQKLIRDVREFDRQVELGGRLFTDEQLVSLRAVRAFLNDKLRTAAYEKIEKPGGGARGRSPTPHSAEVPRRNADRLRLQGPGLQPAPHRGPLRAGRGHRIRWRRYERQAHPGGHLARRLRVHRPRVCSPVLAATFLRWGAELVSLAVPGAEGASSRFSNAPSATAPACPSTSDPHPVNPTE